MKIKIWILITVLITSIMFGYIHYRSNPNSQNRSERATSIKTLKRAEIEITSDISLSTTTTKNQITVDFSWISADQKLSWNILITSQQRSSNLSSQYDFNFHWPIFITEKQIKISPQYLNLWWWTGNIKNTYWEEHFWNMIGRNFQISRDLSDIVKTLSILSNRDMKTPLLITRHNNPLSISKKNQTDFLIQSQEQTWNSFFISLIVKINSNTLELNGNIGKRNIKNTIKKQKNLIHNTFSINNNDTTENLNGNITIKTKPTKSTLQNISKPYTDLIQYLDTLNISF